MNANRWAARDRFPLWHTRIAKKRLETRTKYVLARFPGHAHRERTKTRSLHHLRGGMWRGLHGPQYYTSRNRMVWKAWPLQPMESFSKFPTPQSVGCTFTPKDSLDSLARGPLTRRPPGDKS